MNIELHEHLMRVTVDAFKKEADKLKEQNERLREKLLAESIAINKRADELTFLYADINKLKSKIAMLEASGEQVDVEYYSMRAALMSNGFTQTITGEWKPPLGKRPDFEGQDLIAAAMAFVEAQRDLLDKARKYEERTK